MYGVSYFFTEFGPNMTTFVMPSELYPVTMRATGHGISAGIGKLGAFIGVFLFPLLNSLGLRGTLLLTAGVAALGFALTLVLPEPAGRSLEDMPTSPRQTSALPLQVAGQPAHRGSRIRRLSAWPGQGSPRSGIPSDHGVSVARWARSLLCSSSRWMLFIFCSSG